MNAERSVGFAAYTIAMSNQRGAAESRRAGTPLLLPL